MKRRLLLAGAALGFSAVLIGLLIYHHPLSPEKPGARIEGGASRVAARPVTAPQPAWADRVAAAEDPAALRFLLGEALAMSDPTARQQSMEIVMLSWLGLDRGSFLAFLEEAEVEDLDGADRWARLLPALASALPQVDKAAANSPVLNDVVQKFLELYAGTDVEATLVWLERWTQGDARDQAVAMLIERLALSDPERAGTLLDSIQQPYRRVEGTAGLAMRLAAADPEAGWAWASSRAKPLERAIAMEKALGTIALSDPEKAGLFLADFLSGIQAKTAEALARLPSASPARRTTSEGNTIDPLQAIRANEQSQLARMRDAAAVIAAGLAMQNSSAARIWAEGQPTAWRSAALNAVLARSAIENPAAAFETLRVQPSPDPDTTSDIFEHWATLDAANAAAQIPSLTDPAARRAAVSGLVTGWSTLNESALLSWMDRLPPGTDRDAAYQTLALTSAESDPAKAWRHAANIEDSTIRESVLSETFVNLIAHHPRQARQLLDRTRLSPEVSELLQIQYEGATQSAE